MMFMAAVYHFSENYLEGANDMEEKSLFQVKFECSPTFVEAFDRVSGIDNRSRTQQVKELLERYAGVRADGSKIA